MLTEFGESRPLIVQQNTWGTFVGQAYASEATFVKEARQQGITRRIPLQMLRGFQFGEKIVLLRLRKPDVFAFAEMRVTGVVFNHEVSQAITAELVKDGKAEYHEGGGEICRQCGSYMIAGTWKVQCELSELATKAVEYCSENNGEPFAMLSGQLSRVYRSKQKLEPTPNFTRSFFRFKNDYFFEYLDKITAEAGDVLGIQEYTKAVAVKAAGV